MNIKLLFKNKYICLLATLLLCYVSYKAIYAYDRRADGFTIAKISSTLSYNPEWVTPVTPEQIDTANAILNQPFYYLGRGFQCYAFVSADNKYVLKFFRYQRMRLSEFEEVLPDVVPFVRHFKEGKREDFQKRKEHLFNGIKMGYEYVPQETALVYVHLNKTEGLHKKVAIFDKTGCKYELDMDNMEFMLQRKAQHVKPTIDALMNAGNVEEAKARLAQIYALLFRCAKKGVQDTDGALIRKNNLGFLENQAIYIDSGKLALKESIKTKDGFVKDLKRLQPLHAWLKGKYPELALFFDQEKEREGCGKKPADGGLLQGFWQTPVRAP